MFPLVSWMGRGKGLEAMCTHLFRLCSAHRVSAAIRLEAGAFVRWWIWWQSSLVTAEWRRWIQIAGLVSHLERRKPLLFVPYRISRLSPFLLIGRTFASRTWFGQFDELLRSCVRGPKRFARHALETISRVRRTLRLIGWNLRALLLKRGNNWDSNTCLTAWMFSAARFGGKGLNCELIGGSALSVGPSR